MNIKAIGKQIESEIAVWQKKITQLREAGVLLARLETVHEHLAAPQATRVIKEHKAAKMPPKPKVPKKGQITPEGRERIAAAQNRRWAKVKKAAKVKALGKSNPAVKMWFETPAAKPAPTKKASKARISTKPPASVTPPAKKKSGPEDLAAFHAKQAGPGDPSAVNKAAVNTVEVRAEAREDEEHVGYDASDGELEDE